MNLSRRHFLGMSSALALVPAIGRIAPAYAADGTLTIVSSSVFDAPPLPGSYDIQNEPLIGNGEFLMRPTLAGPEPWVAESVEQIEPTRWRVTIRANVTFQNGTPLNAEALVACLEYYRTPANLADPELVLLGRPTTFEVSGPLSVDIVTPDVFPRMAQGLAHYSFQIFDVAAVTAAGEDTGKLLTAGIFTGPFTWAALEPGVLTYKRYDGYWGGMPALETVIIKKVPDQQAGLQAISAGEADALPYVSLTLAVVAQGLPNVNLVVGPGVGFIGLALEPRIAPFDDVAVRQALAAAVDNEAIAASVGQGIATAMKGWFPSDDPRAVDWLVYDPAKAESLLEGAGWVRDGDGPRAKDGVELEARFYCYTDIGEGVATAAADMASKVGFNATVRRFESYTEIQPVQSVDGGIYTVYTESYGLNGDPVGTMRGVVDPSYTTPGYPDWIAILDAVQTSSDPAELDAALVAGQQLNAEQAYWIPVMDGGTPFAVSDAYKTLEPNPFYLFVDAKLAPSA